MWSAMHLETPTRRESGRLDLVDSVESTLCGRAICQRHVLRSRSDAVAQTCRGIGVRVAVADVRECPHAAPGPQLGGGFPKHCTTARLEQIAVGTCAFIVRRGRTLESFALQTVNPGHLWCRLRTRRSDFRREILCSTAIGELAMFDRASGQEIVLAEGNIFVVIGFFCLLEGTSTSSVLAEFTL